jgi:small subunit ribosomal protein S13
MARLAGVDIPREKRLEIALTYIYGVGKTRAHETLAATGISADVRVKDLSDAELVQLRDYIEGNYKVEGSLNPICPLKPLVRFPGTRHMWDQAMASPK